MTEYWWKSSRGSNHRPMRCSRPPTPPANTFVCNIYGCPDTFPRNSKSSSSCVGPADDICACDIHTKQTHDQLQQPTNYNNNNIVVMNTYLFDPARCTNKIRNSMNSKRASKQAAHSTNLELMKPPRGHKYCAARRNKQLVGSEQECHARTHIESGDCACGVVWNKLDRCSYISV